MAEETDHPWLVEPGPQDQDASIDGNQDQDPAPKGVDDRPGAALLLALVITRLIDAELELLGRLVI